MLTKEELSFKKWLTAYNLDQGQVDFKTWKQLSDLTTEACNKEQQGLSQEDRESMASEQAFKLAAVFGDYAHATDYLKRFKKVQKSVTSTQMVHDACLFNIPQGNLLLWRSLVLHHCPNKPEDKIMQLLPLSKDIESYVVCLEVKILDKIRAEFVEQGVDFSNRTHSETKKANQILKTRAKQLLTPKTPIATLLSYANNLLYQRASENPQAAAIFFENKMPESAFEEYLGLKPKDSQAIPDLIIDGAALSPVYANYYLKKLPSDDPRAAVLGHYTGCCQSLNREGATCVIDGIENEASGFYVLCEKKGDKIRAQCWAWRNAKEDMVFDSVESQVDFQGKNSLMICDMFTRLAYDLVYEKNIPAVYVGANALRNLGVKVGNFASLPDNYQGYSDSKTEQRLVMAENLPLLLEFYCRKMVVLGQNTALKSSDIQTKNSTKDHIKRLIEVCTLNEGISEDSPLHLHHFVSKERLAAAGLTELDIGSWLQSVLKYNQFIKSLPSFPTLELLNGLFEYMADFDFNVDRPFKTIYPDHTPLIAIAVSRGYSDAVEFLIKKGANVHCKVREYPLLHLASGVSYRPLIMKSLIEGGANIKTVFKNTIADIFRGLPDFMAFKEMVDRCIPTPDEIRQQEEMAQKFEEYRASNFEGISMEEGIRVSTLAYPENLLLIQDVAGYTATHYAAKLGWEALAYIHSMGGDINAKSKNNETPLDIAIKNGKFDAVKYLVKHEVVLKDNQLAAAALLEDKTIYQYLVKKSAKEPGMSLGFFSPESDTVVEKATPLQKPGKQ